MKIDVVLRRKAGVYQLVNKTNGKSYIGSSVDIYNRLNTYKCLSKRGKVHNKHLQYSLNKYGIDAFEVTVLEFVDLSDIPVLFRKERLIQAEQRWLDQMRPEYNKRKIADLNCQISPDLSTREKISIGLKKAFLEGRKIQYRVQESSTKVSLFDLEGNLIERFDSCGLLAEFIGRKGQSLLRHAFRRGRTNRCGEYLIYLTSEEDKVVPHSVTRKELYDRRDKRNKAKRSVGQL